MLVSSNAIATTVLQAFQIMILSVVMFLDIDMRKIAKNYMICIVVNAVQNDREVLFGKWGTPSLKFSTLNNK